MPVTLKTSSGERFPARVLERGEDTLLVAIIVRTEPISPRMLEEMVVEYVGPHGPVALRGTITSEDPASPEVLRIDAPREIKGAFQKRKDFRLTATYPVIVHHRGHGLPFTATPWTSAAAGFSSTCR